MSRWNAVFVFTLLASVCCWCSGEQPLATIAVVSNPYITTLPPEEIKDENGRVRDFLATTAPDSMKKTIDLVNSIEPDALVMLGSLTWSGSAADVAALRQYVEQVKVPTWVTPGHRDRLAGSLDEFRKQLAEFNVENSVKELNGVTLAFAGDLDRNPDAATERLERQLATSGPNAASSRAVLLFSGLDRSLPRSALTDDHDRFWPLVEQRKIAVRLDPTRYGHQVDYVNTLPVWSVASSGWSARGAVTLVRVMADRIEMAEIADPQIPAFSLTVPNPVQTSRLPAAEQDAYRCPSYSSDLAAGPEFTFALVSDPQFDRSANRQYLMEKAAAAIEELNRLKPELVFVAGDLVNNNLPEEWEIFHQVFAKLEPRMYTVPGNHDVLFNYDFVESSYATAPEKNPEYAATVRRALAAAEKDGFQGPTALYEKYTGSKPRQLITHRNCAFVTVPFLTTRADKEQVGYLGEQLARAADMQHVFVVAHYPTLPFFGNNVQPDLGGTEVLSLLHQHRVTGYLFGHRHRNGFRLHERTAHLLTDNMSTIHLLHVFDDHVVIGRKRVGSPLYEKLIIPSPRR